MFIDSNALTKAISRISIIASLDNKQPGILFDIADDHIDVFYNSNYKAIINTVDAQVGPDEVHGKVIFDYKRLTDTMNYCKSSGRIIVGNLEMVLGTNPDGSGTAKINVVKKIARSDGVNSTEEVVSSNTYDLTWTPIEKASVIQKTLKNEPCEDMFNEADDSLWDVSEFNRLISSACNGDAKILYFSSRHNGVFTVNDNNTVYVKSSNKVNRTIQFQTKDIKAIANVLNTLDAEDIHINTIFNDMNQPFASLFFTSDHKLSIFMTIAHVQNIHMQSISRFMGTQYKTYNFNILTEVLVDTLKAIINLSVSADGEIKFEKDVNGGVIATLTAENTGASINNVYRITCDSFNTVEDIQPGSTIITIKPNMKMLLDIVSNNKDDHTAFDIGVDANGSNANTRIGFIDVAESLEVLKEMIVEDSNKSGGMVIDNDSMSVFDNVDATAIKSKDDVDEATLSNFIDQLTPQDKLDMRDKYLKTCYFSTINKV